MIVATAINSTTAIMNESLKLMNQVQPQAVKDHRGYRRISHHLGLPLCGRPRVRLLALPGAQTEADSDQTLEAAAGQRRRLTIKASQADLSNAEP